MRSKTRAFTILVAVGSRKMDSKWRISCVIASICAAWSGGTSGKTVRLFPEKGLGLKTSTCR